MALYKLRCQQIVFVLMEYLFFQCFFILKQRCRHFSVFPFPRFVYKVLVTTILYQNVEERFSDCLLNANLKISHASYDFLYSFKHREENNR